MFIPLLKYAIAAPAIVGGGVAVIVGLPVGTPVGLCEGLESVLEGKEVATTTGTDVESFEDLEVGKDGNLEGFFGEGDGTEDILAVDFLVGLAGRLIGFDTGRKVGQEFFSPSSSLP